MGYFDSLWKFIAISAPFLTLGLFASGLIHAFFPMDKIKKSLGGKSLTSVIKASLLGIPIPLCSCAVIPMAVTLKKNGANNGATSSFLISTPESGVDSIAVTYALMDLPMTIIRPIAAFITAFCAGVMQLIFNSEEIALPVEEKKSCCSHKKNEEVKEKSLLDKLKGAIRYGFVNLIDDMSFWLMVGICFGAAIDFLIPGDFLATLNGPWGRFLILAIGIPLYICASASTPIAASLILKGLSPGSAVLFLLVGPATNVSSIFVLQKYIGKKGVFINIVVIGVVALGMSYIVDYIYEFYGWPVLFKVGEHQHEESFVWWRVVCGVLISLLVLKGVIKGVIKTKVLKK